MNYLRLMADYSSSGMWDKEGVMVDINEIPISNELKHHIQAWVAWYDTYSNTYDEDNDKTQHYFDAEIFAAHGLQLAKMLKQELPSWKIIYFDEFAIAPNAPRTQYEYEVLL